MSRLLTLLFIVLFVPLQGIGQVQAPIIQFSGFVMSSDSLDGIPYCHISVGMTGRGTVADFDGYFSLAARETDTILFSAVGYKEDVYVIPAKLDKNKYSVIQLLTEDTIFLSETIIYPWPSREQFRQAFIDLDIPDDELERARKNLEKERLRELGEVMAMDGDENSDYYMRQQAKKFYYAGQAPPMNIFNPFAWAEFIKAWKNGDFKKKKKKN